MDELKLKPMKTTAQMKEENIAAAKAVPVEKKREFWRLMMSGKTLKAAREAVGLDIMVAAELVILCHRVEHIPMTPDEIE